VLFRMTADSRPLAMFGMTGLGEGAYLLVRCQELQYKHR
jgi:hypothetical protein